MTDYTKLFNDLAATAKKMNNQWTIPTLNKEEMELFIQCAQRDAIRNYTGKSLSAVVDAMEDIPSLKGVMNELKLATTSIWFKDQAMMLLIRAILEMPKEVHEAMVIIYSKKVGE